MKYFIVLRHFGNSCGGSSGSSYSSFCLLCFLFFLDKYVLYLSNKSSCILLDFSVNLNIVSSKIFKLSCKLFLLIITLSYSSDNVIKAQLASSRKFLSLHLRIL